MFYLEITFFAVALLQLFYLLALCIAFLRKPGAHAAHDLPALSVIVCAHDEAENLQELVPLLLTQDYPSFEVVVVDDRSNDSTLDWLLTETKKDHRLRMVHVNRAPEHVNGKKYGLTLGIRAALHEWLVFTDADCRPASRDWLRQMARQCKTDSTFVLGYSPYQKKAGLLNQFIRFEALLTAIQYIGFALLKLPYMGVGRNMAYRKSLFMDTKGFSSILSVTGGDDDLFVNQHATGHNTETALGPEALVYSIPKTTWADFRRQKLRHLAAGKKYKFKHRLLLGIFMLSWLATHFLGLPLLFLSQIPWVIGGLLLVRLLLASLTLHAANKKFGDAFEIWSLLWLDIIYSIYYLTTGTAALVTKRIRWKN